MRSFFLLFLACCYTSLLFAQSGDSLRIQYIGNMGVLISNQQQSVLIDGLHSFYKPEYLPPPEKLVEELITNQSDKHPPVQLLLNTHIHGDHFDPVLVHRFLRHNPASAFMGSTQAQEQILKQGKTVEKQIHSVSMKSYERHTFRHQGIDVIGFYINHGYAARHHAIENIGFLLEIAGKHILHVGDTEWYEEVFAEHQLQEEQIDIAILPYWMLMTGEAKKLVDKWINPAQIIGTHIPPQAYEANCEKIHKSFPQAILFTELGQQFVYH